jgi:hypothetical protein
MGGIASGYQGDATKEARILQRKSRIDTNRAAKLKPDNNDGFKITFYLHNAAELT